MNLTDEQILDHSRSCPVHLDMHGNDVSPNDEKCTCGLEYRKQIRQLQSNLDTEITMHKAWEKRAYEAEAALSFQASEAAEFTDEQLAMFQDNADRYGLLNPSVNYKATCKFDDKTEVVKGTYNAFQASEQEANNASESVSEWLDNWQGNYDFTMPLKAHVELRKELIRLRISPPLTTEAELVRKALESALERMDRARNILTNGKPTPECNWGMLDTSDIRALLPEGSEG